MDESNVKLSTLCSVIAIFILSSTTPLVSQAEVWYVDCDVVNSGNCTSWEDACITIQEAIDASTAEDEIWVKQGTYVISSTIDVYKSVLIFGGFDGTESQRNQRDWINKVVTLDGQNSGVRRMYIHSDAIIDGFVITGGDGGGMAIPWSSPVIKNCTFEGNRAIQGGGISNEGYLTINNCIFIGNTARWEGAWSFGGAITNVHTGSLTISDCFFSENTVNGDEWNFGGGIYNDYGSLTITNCIFSENAAINGSRNHGGGVYNTSGSLMISNCVFSGNTVNGDEWNFGGGIYNQNASLTITNCIFSENTATDGMWNEGGSVYISHDSLATITNSTFIRNGVFSDNIMAYNYGGGIFVDFNNDDTVFITNCILWYNYGGDYDGQQLFFREYPPLVRYSNINKNGYEGMDGNIREEPLFVDYEMGDYHLQEGSPCIDMGDPEFDYSNEPTPHGCRINMGAYGNTIEATLSSDIDCDGVYGDGDNCPNVENPEQENTDTDSLGDACDNCPHIPNPDQIDSFPPGGNGIGDACECEADFDCNGNVDALDLMNFLWDFGRSAHYDPCTNLRWCYGDFDCNGAVDSDDLTKFLEDFGRGQYSNTCPACVEGDWCVYP